LEKDLTIETSYETCRLPLEHVVLKYENIHSSCVLRDSFVTMFIIFFDDKTSAGKAVEPATAKFTPPRPPENFLAEFK